MTNTFKWIKAIKKVAQQVSTPAESFNLVQYVLATIPYVEPGEEGFEQIKALDEVCHYWDEHGCYEDEIAPALAILHAIATYSFGSLEDIEHILRMTNTLHDMLLNPSPEGDEFDMTYEQFCDKYAEDLSEA